MQLPEEPLFLTPKLCETIWGGKRLVDEFGKQHPPDTLVGESWEVSGFSSNQTMVESGLLKGITLGTLYSRHAAELVGISASQLPLFPLLVKFIDAQQPLSVQVHPDDTAAKLKFNEPCGKTECWYIASAGSNARLALGFTKDTTRNELRSAIASGAIDAMLNIFPVHTGEVYFIPAGTVHAILGDIVIYEVQQTSATTLRMYDWGRTDSTGKPRTLHIDDAIAVVNLRQTRTTPIKALDWSSGSTTSQLRVACRYFALEEFYSNHKTTITLPHRASCQIITVTKGNATLSWNSGSVTLRKGTTVLLPAILRDADISASCESRILATFIPDWENEIVKPLTKQGYSLKEIEDLGNN